MGLVNSHLRAENVALREEVTFLRKQLMEERKRNAASGADSPPETDRPNLEAIKMERRSSLGALPILGRADKIVSGVLPLAAAFDKFDDDKSGGIDIKELRAALEYLGVSVTSDQASNILKQYDSYPDNVIDVKEFATIVKDIKLLLEFDENHDGVLDANELLAALESLGLNIDLEQVQRILYRFDVNNSGTIDLVELSSLVRTVQAFMRYDVDKSGSIDLEELRNALRKLGLRAGALEATDIFRRYDADESGMIDVSEFAVLVRDLQLYASFDTNYDGLIDDSELHQVFERLGLSLSLEATRAIIGAWDPAGDGTLDLPKFSQLVAEVRVFKDHDTDADGKVDSAQLRSALRSLGVDMGTASPVLQRAEAKAVGGVSLVQFAAIIHELTGGKRAVANMSAASVDDVQALSVAKTKLTGSGLADEVDRKQIAPTEAQVKLLIA